MRTGFTLTVVGTRYSSRELIRIPIYNGFNLIVYLNFTETDLCTFDDNPVNLDKVRRYIPGPEGGYKTATYWNGNWVGSVSDVEPIERGVAYEYDRMDDLFWWIYPA